MLTLYIHGTLHTVYGVVAQYAKLHRWAKISIVHLKGKLNKMRKKLSGLDIISVTVKLKPNSFVIVTVPQNRFHLKIVAYFPLGN